MKTRTYLVIAIGCLGLNLTTVADVLELKNGTILNGKYQGGTADTVRFDSGSGTQVVATSEIIALTFTTQKAAAAAPAVASAAPAAAAAPAPAPAPQAINLPAGTTLVVRTVEAVSSQNKAGTPFTTRLEYDLAGSLKAGTTIQGKVQSSTQAGRARGKSTLDLRLTAIVVNGKQVPISTSGYQQAGQASIKKAAKGAAAGAAIGAIADDAGKGAAIGAVAGAATKGQTITVPPGTLIEFTLQQPVTL
jgi:YD repeat-containing protein